MTIQKNFSFAQFQVALDMTFHGDSQTVYLPFDLRENVAVPPGNFLSTNPYEEYRFVPIFAILLVNIIEHRIL